MEQSTTASTGNNIYGYLWWLFDDNSYSAAGIFGQGIYINPDTGVVIAINSAWGVATSDRNVALKLAMYFAIDEAVSQ
jgi:CubicO group peptidase (beta-lactamase class C family)